MAEARAEEEEDLRRDGREQVVRRQPSSSGGRPDRRKPEHRLSQGPLSSIRAAIKRTSTRSTSLSETSRDRDRERDRERDRRRPEITILSAEPLAATSSWFPGGSGGFPPPPPPAAQVWGPTIPPSIQPPPSYEEVIREKTQEQVLLPSSSSSSSSPSRPVSTITIATQTDAGSVPEDSELPIRRPVRPQRPPLPHPQKSSHVDDVTTGQSVITSLDRVITHPEPSAHTSTNAQCCDLLAELCAPLTSTSASQTDGWDRSSAAAEVATPLPADKAPGVPLERPRPRPRSKLGLRPVSSEVKVQTLVKLREDGLATLAAATTRTEINATNRDSSQGKYLQELLDAFSSDDWGFADHRSDSSELSQSESEDDEDMATLRGRIQAFEQQQVADESCGDRQSGTDEAFVASTRPEPQPRPRLQGQPSKSIPPVIAPKPKNFSPGPKPSSKVFWEEWATTTPADAPEALSVGLNPKPPTPTEPSALGLEPQPCKTTEKPPITPKLQSTTETSPSGLPSLTFAPVPSPRPPPPKLSPSLSDTSSPPHPKLPPRPPVAPRASVGAPQPDKRPADMGTTPTLPPRPSVEVGGRAPIMEGRTVREETQNQSVKAGSVRPGVPAKPAALMSQRRASAPNLAPKPTGVSPPDPATVKPTAPATAPKPSGTAPTKLPTAAPTLAPAPAPTPAPAPAPTLAPVPAPALAPTPAPAPALALVPAPAPGPAPALRKGPVVPSKSETTNTVGPNSSDLPLPPRPSSVKLLPLRPPPIKSIPGRPPPPTINSSASANQITPPSKTSPTPSVSAASQHSPSQTSSSSTANQTQAQRVTKRGPPLPPRPKPGHPLYSTCGKQEVLIVLDDPSPSPSEPLSDDGSRQTTVTPLINPSHCLLELDTQPEPIHDQDCQSKPALEGLGRSDSQSILPVQPAEQKEQPDSPPISSPRCIATFDYEGEEDDELTFSQGDVIALLELVGQEWGRGRIHGREGIFPLNFAEVVEPLPQPPTSQDETGKPVTTQSTAAPKTPRGPDSLVEEWAVALFDFPGQTAEDLSFQKGALIRVSEYVDAEWRRGRLDGREGLYPVAFTQPYQSQQSVVKGAARTLFDFAAESEEELTVKVGDIITQVESVDERWISGVVGGKRGMVPKNYISLL